MKRRKSSITLIFLVTFLLFTGCTEEKPPIDQQTAYTRVKEIFTLPAVDHIYRSVVYLGQQNAFLGIPTVDKRVLFSIRVRVTAGLDLTSNFNVVFSGPDKVTVSLPAATILSADADESSIHQFFIKEYGDRVSRLEYYDQIAQSKRQVVQDAIERGILLRAEENSRTLVTALFESLGFTQVRVFFADAPPRQEDTSEGDTQ